MARIAPEPEPEAAKLKAAISEVDLEADIDVVPLLATVVADADEDPKTKAKREAEEAKKKSAEFTAEYGRPVGLRKMCSPSTWSELFVYWFGWFGAIVHGCAAPGLVLIFGNMIDSLGGANGFDMNEIKRQAVWFTLLGIGVIISGGIQDFGFRFFSARVAHKLRPKYFEAALHRDIAWFDVHDIGAFPVEMTQDLEDLQAGLGATVGISVMAVTQLFVGYLLGFWKGWLLALIISVTAPFMGIGFMLMGQAMNDILQETQGSYAQAAKVVEEVLFAVRTVVAFGGEAREVERFRKFVDKARTGGIQNRFRVGAGMGYTWGFMFLTYAIAFYSGMLLRYHDIKDPFSGEVYSAGRIIIVFFAILTGGFSLGMIPQGVQDYMKAKNGATRMFWIIETPAAIQQLNDSRETVHSIDTLELKQVRFCYPARPDVEVLKGLNMIITKGKKHAVVGESGCGKSTVMGLIERFYDPSSGVVLLNGSDLRNYSVKSFRKLIGYVGQEPVLFATSVRNNIMQGCETASEKDFNEATNNAQMDFIQKLPDKFETFVGSGGSQFSGGQKQRIAIARALLKKPSMMYLDEATSALDSTSEKLIQGTLDHIGASAQGMTIVSIAHRLSTVRNSDVIYVLKAGEVMEFGSHSELKDKPGGLYSALAAAQTLAGEGAEDEEGSNQPMMEKRTSSKQAADVAKRISSSRLSDKGTKAFETDEEKEREKKIAKEYKVPYGRILGYAREKWCWFGPAIFGSILNGAAFPMIGALMLSEAMTAFMQPDKEEVKRKITVASLVFVGGAVALFIGNIMQFGGFGILGETIVRNVRLNLMSSVMSQEIGFHDNPQYTPILLAKAFQVYANRMQTLCITIGDKFQAVTSLLSGTVVAFAYAWQMAGAMLAVTPILAIASSLQMIGQMGGGKEQNNMLNRAQQVLGDAIINARTVQACGNEKQVVELYTQMIRGVTKGSNKKHLISAIGFGISDAMQFFVMAFGFWFLGWLIENDHTDFDKGMKSFMGLLFGAMSMGMAAAMMGNLASASVAAHDMFELMDRKPLINGLEPIGNTPKESFDVGHIELRNVSFYYPFRKDVQVLKSLSFKVQSGQSIGLAGPSGGGKSTVMAMIQRFYDPQEGDVLLGPDTDKVVLRNQNIRWWRQQIGFVGQEPILFEGTILDNVQYGLGGASIEEKRLLQLKEMANMGFIDRAQGWQTQVGPRGSRLSGGQKQRVAICRGLARNPPILLLDEATSALDSQSEQVVSKALEAARQGRTSFAIAHRLSTIQDCDIIMVVGEGRILESGSHIELMEKEGVYSKLVKQSQQQKSGH
mmetsp:Transcript_51793/g.80916  ORF Transcript_51793/g.80916 Transcript_51793/m.80916 type:complete len:1310 (-) Transcript_51793:206-4135(-)